jgi:amino acid adenylation domain-containing protein
MNGKILMNNECQRESYPLSPLQEGMLFHSFASVGTGVDIVQVICRVRERLDLETFQRAWARVVERHAVLRSQFEWEELDEPRQVVLSEVSLPGECCDWKHLSGREQEESFEGYLQKDRAQGFDIGQAPLLRLAFFDLGGEAYRLVWTFHHIIMDGRVIPLLLEEAFAIYQAFVEGRAVVPDDPHRYRDYVEWVRNRDLARDEKFWRENLAGFTSPTPFAVGAARGAETRTMGSGGTAETRIPEALTSALRQLASGNGLSMNTLVEGAWALLLSRYSGEEDILYGTIRSCRRASVAGAESMIGLLLNTVPIRVRMPKQLKLIDFLRQLRGQHSQMREYIHAPLFNIQKWSDIPPGSALFESLVVFDNYYLDSYMKSKGGRWADRGFEIRRRTNYPLTLVVNDDVEMVFQIGFDQGRFTDDTVQRMLGHLKTILHNLPENLQASVAEIPLLTEPERRQLLVEWNSTLADYPADRCLHELFERQVERTPDALALVFEDQRLSYGELNRRANQLAHHLRKQGVGPEVCVGIFMERSVEMVVGIYGVVKAGGAYVPLDPEHPPERVAFMLQDTRVPVVLTQERLKAGLPHSDARVICLDCAGPELALERAQNLASGATGDNLAYLIYTSGSTGMPKGVMNTRRGICNRLLWMQDAYRLAEGERVLQKTPYSFDVSVWEFFWPLSAGATLVVARPGGHRESDYLVRTIREQEITTLHFVPSMLQIFLDEKDVGECSTLKRVICSGEALSYELQEQFFSRLPAELHNLYGPTEAAVDVTYWPCQRGSARRMVPIGYPVANTQMYILDPRLQPVPIGVSGELYIGGVQVARGYLNRPELSAGKFIPDPFSSLPGARLYRTGDLARYLYRGEIEYLGRSDHQVKIRGFRIEPMEIEAVLEQHGTVGQVVVMAREDHAGDKRLVAYIVADGGQTPCAGVLRDYLQGKLPEYMVPNAFVMLEEFPLFPNGKVDRRALPAPEYTRPEKAYIAPRAPAEIALAKIWAEVLGVERVGVDDNFFELGGHSLLAVKLFVSIRKWAGIDLPLATLFRSPTVRGLAELLDSGRAEAPVPGERGSEMSAPVQQWCSLVPMQPEGGRPPFFVIHAIGGNVLNYFSLLPHLGPEQPVYGLQARGLDGVQPPYASIEEMAGGYIAEIRSVQPCGPYFLGGASFGGTVAYEIARQLMLEGEKVATLALFDAVGPGARGYHYWRRSLKRRLSRKRDVEAGQSSLALYLPIRMARYLSNRLRTLRCGLFQLMRRPIPLELREWHVLINHNKGLNLYIPHPYLGPVVLFRGPAQNRWPYNDPELGWKGVIEGDLKIIIVDAPHLEFMEPPELGILLAKELKTAQDRAQVSGLATNRFPLEGPAVVTVAN